MYADKSALSLDKLFTGRLMLNAVFNDLEIQMKSKIPLYTEPYQTELRKPYRIGADI